MIKKKHEHFLILEVLIAFLLISMTILPFTSYPYKAFQRELSYLEMMTFEPYFAASFHEALEIKDEGTFTLSDMYIPFGNKDILTVDRSIKIKIKNDKKTSFSLITVDVTLSSRNAEKTRTRVFSRLIQEKKDAI